ncbi:MAG: hypothetical protein ACLFPV_03380 [Spirochaetaceae bacterium]
MRRGRFRGAVIFLAGLTATSCAFLDSERDVVVHFPPLPETWKSLERELEIAVEVVFSDGSGWTRHHAFDAGAAVIALPKAGGVAILLRPVYRGLLLPPAGTAVPWLASGERAATWHDGVTATILRRLAVGGSGFEALNVPRLSREIRDRGGRDPWGVDIDRIVEKLAEDAFRSTYIKEGETVSLEVYFPEGRWVSLEPFGEEGTRVIEGPGGVTLSVPLRGARYAEIQGRRVLSVAFEPSGHPIVGLRGF